MKNALLVLSLGIGLNFLAVPSLANSENQTNINNCHIKMQKMEQNWKKMLNSGEASPFRSGAPRC